MSCIICNICSCLEANGDTSEWAGVILHHAFTFPKIQVVRQDLFSVPFFYSCWLSWELFSKMQVAVSIILFGVCRLPPTTLSWTCQLFFFFNHFLNVYSFIFERERVRAGKRETSTESDVGSKLRAVSIEPNGGFERTKDEIMTWAKVRCLTDWAIQVPLFF